jgi:hypothetical protein
VWHLFAPALPEATKAIARIGAFTERMLADSRKAAGHPKA